MRTTNEVILDGVRFPVVFDEPDGDDVIETQYAVLPRPDATPGLPAEGTVGSLVEETEEEAT